MSKIIKRKEECRIHKVIFAPMTDGLDQFQAFAKYLGLDFPCERCDHPFFC